MHKFSKHWQQGNLLLDGHSFFQKKKNQNNSSTFSVQKGVFYVHY